MFEAAVQVLDWFKTLNKEDRPVTVEVKGEHYAVKTDGTLGEVVRSVIPLAPVATPVLELSTLSGLVGAFTADVDGFSGMGKSAVMVESFDQVAIVSLAADQWGRRHVWARATCKEKNPFPFGDFMESELFLVKAQASFLPVDGHYSAMLKLCSNLTTGSSIQVADDGFSQKVVIQDGGVSRGEVVLPPRIVLRPYRSFREVDPVESDFLLRFKAVKDGLPLVALIPVDAGRWKTDTALAVGSWLGRNLPIGTVLLA